MTNYNTLTIEQKESITKELRDLFEELESINEKIHNNLLSTIDFKEILIEKDKIKSEIKGFQEGEKLAIKIIDEEIEFLENKLVNHNNEMSTLEMRKDVDERIEELKKQKEHLEWESKLE